LSLLGLSAERKQTPQIVEKPEDVAGIKEPKEANFSLHTQEVTGSSPVAPTIQINNFRTPDVARNFNPAGKMG
jgi:hypothetical protein